MLRIVSRHKTAFCLLLWTIVVQLFCNIDSYLYAQCGQCDSAAFFMCGKALMNGMIPYTDFTDSKGVLLWLIYGLGYLMDHYSYVGVFWLACFFVWFTLVIAYKTARLFLDEKPALLSAMLLLVPLMYWNFYTETKAEHFCWPAVAWGIYVMMRQERSLPCSKWHYAGVGMGIAACLMIKWSVAVMMLSLLAGIIWLAVGNRDTKRCLAGSLFGIVATLLPFAVWFTMLGNWQDMWQEYFINTLSSVSLPFSETVSAYCLEWQRMFTTRRFLYLLYTLPVLVLWSRKRWFASALPALCGLFFIALSIRHDIFGHYISVAGPFAILTIIVFVRFWQSRHIRLRYLAACGLVTMLYVIWGSIRYSDSFCTKAGEKFDRFMAVSAEMAQVENPKIIIIGQERGLCMGTSLPGTRYWITQLGRTEQMWQAQVAAIESRSADFVICFGGSAIQCEDSLQRLGYAYLDECYAGRVYSRTAIDTKSDRLHYSVWEIISRKNYCCR